MFESKCHAFVMLASNKAEWQQSELGIRSIGRKINRLSCS
jgi:hypothetical protein